METQNLDKRLELQRSLERQRRASTWKIALGTAVFIAIMRYNAHSTADIIICSFVFIVLWLLFFWEPVRDMNMNRLEGMLRKKITEEDEYVIKIKEEYRLIEQICKSSFNAIPGKFKPTAIYLLYEEDKTPEEIIADREEEVADMKIQLQCYKDCKERTFWRYTASYKWLKRLPR
ncbi:MAG: hypothetical protein NTX91_01375 [candidate division SR1 bacterium]|nr:hypothetical protein [candidate division SR1 bacterium]